MERQNGHDALRVAAVQWARQPFALRKVTLSQAGESLGAALEVPLSEAARAGARLAVLAWGLYDGLAEAGGVAPSEEVLSAFEDLGGRLARSFEITLAAGPALVTVPGGVQRAAYVFGPDGRVLGMQAQTHRSAGDRAAGLRVGAELVPIETPVGRLGLVTDADVEYPEVSRILSLQGAHLLVHQAALSHWNEAVALVRLWREVQANQLFGVEAYAVGAGFRGRSAIHAPLEMTPGNSGWLARAPDDERAAVVLADLDLEQLARVREAYPIDRLRNEAQYRRYFPAVYEAGPVRRAPMPGEPLGTGAVSGSALARATARRRPAYELLLRWALEPWMRLHSRPSRVRAALEGLPYARAEVPVLPRVRIAVVQFDINLVFDAVAYARHVYEMVRRAVEGGASLAVFPEYVTLPLMGLLPGAARLAAMLEPGAKQAAAERPESSTDGSYDVMALAFRLAARAARCVHRATFSTLAARFGITLVAGSAIEVGADGRLYNVAYLYGPDGSERMHQVKTHLVPSEVQMGYGTGEEIRVVETPAGPIAFPVCMDHTYFETARIAALLGAALLIDPSANNEYYNPYAQARGVWNRVQEVHTYGALCSGVGRVAGLVFQGRSGVYAPLGMTPAGDGVLAQAETFDQEEVVFADLDYAALDAYRSREPLEFNLDLYRRYLPGAYNLRGL